MEETGMAAQMDSVNPTRKTSIRGDPVETSEHGIKCSPAIGHATPSV